MWMSKVKYMYMYLHVNISSFLLNDLNQSGVNCSGHILHTLLFNLYNHHHLIPLALLWWVFFLQQSSFFSSDQYFSIGLRLERQVARSSSGLLFYSFSGKFGSMRGCIILCKYHTFLQYSTSSFLSMVSDSSQRTGYILPSQFWHHPWL